MRCLSPSPLLGLAFPACIYGTGTSSLPRINNYLIFSEMYHSKVIYLKISQHKMDTLSEVSKLKLCATSRYVRTIILLSSLWEYVNLFCFCFSRPSISWKDSKIGPLFVIYYKISLSLKIVHFAISRVRVHENESLFDSFCIYILKNNNMVILCNVKIGEM